MKLNKKIIASKVSEWDFNCSAIECRTSASTNERVGGDEK